MSYKREKLRAGIALMEAAARMIEQAKTEFGGTLDSKYARFSIEEAIRNCRIVAKRAVVGYVVAYGLVKQCARLKKGKK